MANCIHIPRGKETEPEDPFRQGYDTVGTGKDDGGFANPYPKGSVEYVKWESGWSAAWEDECYVERAEDS
jgi:hypothetical protein